MTPRELTSLDRVFIALLLTLIVVVLTMPATYKVLHDLSNGILADENGVPSPWGLVVIFCIIFIIIL